MYGTPSPPKIDFYYVNRSYCTRTDSPRSHRLPQIAPIRFTARRKSPSDSSIACSGPISHSSAITDSAGVHRTYIRVPIRSHVRVSGCVQRFARRTDCCNTLRNVTLRHKYQLRLRMRDNKRKTCTSSNISLSCRAVIIYCTQGQAKNPCK